MDLPYRESGGAGLARGVLRWAQHAQLDMIRRF